jgi:amino-acid N-acetyltransferase
MQKIIAKNIRKLRNLHNMSLSELAQKIAMSPGNLSRIERGELNITIKILEKIAQIFQCQFQDLFLNSEFEAPNSFVEQFRRASKYINTFSNKIFVIAIGGDVLKDHQFESIAYDINLLRSLGIRIILVHGIRPQIDELLLSKKLKTALVKNVRVTDSNTMNHVIDVTGRIRTKIESILSSSLINSPLFGSDIRLSSGNFITARPLGVVDGVDMQFTGQVRKVDHEVIQARLNNGEVVLISPLGFSPVGDVFNLSYEQLASSVANAVKAHKLIFFYKF